MKAWRVFMDGCDPFTFITDQCHNADEVMAAIIEKFCRPALKVERL